jgi:hypothetical protein
VTSWNNDDTADLRLNFPFISKQYQRRISGHFLYVLCNEWKERSRRVFSESHLTYLEMADIAREDILQSEHAFTGFKPAIQA